MKTSLGRNLPQRRLRRDPGVAEVTTLRFVLAFALVAAIFGVALWLMGGPQ